MNLGRLAAYVRAGDDDAPILGAEGVLWIEVETGGDNIADHEMPLPSFSGLAVFEGWVVVESGEDGDVRLEGRWRPMSHWEVCRLRVGLMPWDEEAS